MSSRWGRNLSVTIFGESHGPAVGVVVDGLPAGFRPDMAAVRRQMARRAAGGKPWATQRAETDEAELVSGFLDGRCTGAPLTALIRNGDAHSSSYGPEMELPRPGHADYTAHVRYGGAEDHRGGGHFSGRLTAPLVFAGALAAQLLATKGVAIGSHIRRIGPVEDTAWNSTELPPAVLADLSASAFPVLNDTAAGRMMDAIVEARVAGDSLGGEIETAVVGLPAGVGSPFFDGVESALAALLFSIPAVKGVQFGAGFALAAMRGSRANDPFVVEDGAVRAATNNNGGLLGGITTGLPVVFTVAVKPTPSIALPQRTVNLRTMEPAELAVKGRHDPCIVPRAVPAVEAAAALALLDAWLDEERAW